MEGRICLVTGGTSGVGLAVDGAEDLGPASENLAVRAGEMLARRRAPGQWRPASRSVGASIAIGVCSRPYATRPPTPDWAARAHA